MILTLRWFLVLFTAVAVDACWALYLRRAGSGHAIRSANWAVLLIGLGMFNTKSWLGDWRFIPAVLIGSWLGTFVAVRHDAK